MLISIKENKIINKTFYKNISYGEIEIYYSGIIFLLGMKAGKDSIDCIVKNYKEKGKIPFRKIFGSYAIVLQDKNKLIVFTDNSNMHGI